MTNAKIKLLFLFFFFSLLININAQKTLKVNIRASGDTLNTDIYIPQAPEPGTNELVLPMQYGSYELQNVKALKKIKNSVITEIKLVYTAFPKDIDLDELNRKRLAALYIECPTIFDNYLTQWKFVAQQKCSNDYEASHLFHGFVIQYRAAPTAASMASEREYLKKTASGALVLTDSSVLKIMNRKKNWKEMMVVCDVTGSMSPYIAQVMVWQTLNFKKKAAKSFVFFNDGDNTPDASKITGATGGIYATSCDNLDSVITTASIAMTAGGGGDAPENDVEALLYGMAKYKDCKEIVLIADNWADMRDYSMIKKVNKPVHIIVCGVTNRINTQYLDLARACGGTVHTMEQDLENLVKLNEGEVIKIGTTRYRIVKGKFVILSI